MVQIGVLLKARDEAQRHADQDGQHEGSGLQQEGGRQGLSDSLRHRVAIHLGVAEVSPQQFSQPYQVADVDGLVQTQALPHRFPVDL